jgi:hypothetical protein
VLRRVAVTLAHPYDYNPDLPHTVPQYRRDSGCLAREGSDNGYMGSESRQRALFAARAVVVLVAVVVVLVIASRTRSNPQDTVAAKATHSPAAAHSPAATPAPATHAATSSVQVAAVRPLCQAVPDLARFSIQVLGPPHQDGAINVSDAGTVTQASQAQSVARQLCALPALLAKPEACLASVGQWFQLIFDARDGEYWTVWAGDGGCEQVIGVGDQTRTAMSAGPPDLRDSQPLSTP